jgi:hypothetical protein
MFFEKNKCMYSLSDCQKENRHDMNYVEIFISDVDSQILNILGSNKLINLHLLIFCKYV